MRTPRQLAHWKIFVCIVGFLATATSGRLANCTLAINAAPRNAAQDVVTESSDGETEQQPSETVAVDDVAPDDAISDRLSQIFSSSGWFESLDVQADNGIVTLTGTAKNAEAKTWAAGVAKKTQDVVAVINKLQVSQEVDFSTSRDVVVESLESLYRDLLQRSPLFLASLIVLILTALLAKGVALVLGRILSNRSIRASLQDLMLQLSTIGIWIVGLLVATVVAFPGMTPAKALTVLGLGSVAIGFAFKDIFENFFAGMLILWQYPFDRGDFIQCGDLLGKVEHISIRNTVIRKLDGELAVVPNATLFKNSVDVLTSQPQRRVRIICGVAYDEDVDEARDVITQAVRGCKSIEGQRTVEVFAQEFADSSINFEVAWWTGSKPLDIRRSRDEVVAAIKRALDEAGIEIPFPYRTLTFKDPRIAAGIGGEGS